MPSAPSSLASPPAHGSRGQEFGVGNQLIGVNLCSLYQAFGLRCSPTSPRSRREGSEREMLRLFSVASGLSPATPDSEEGGQAMAGQRHKRIGLAGGGSWIQLAGRDDSARCHDKTRASCDGQKTEEVWPCAQRPRGHELPRGTEWELGAAWRRDWGESSRASALAIGAHSGLRGRAIQLADRQASSSSGGVNEPGRRDEVYHVPGSACNARRRGARSPAPLLPSISCQCGCGPSSARACAATG